MVPPNPYPPNQPSAFCAPCAKKTTPSTRRRIVKVSSLVVPISFRNMLVSSFVLVHSRHRLMLTAVNLSLLGWPLTAAFRAAHRSKTPVSVLSRAIADARERYAHVSLFLLDGRPTRTRGYARILLGCPARLYPYCFGSSRLIRFERQKRPAR